MTRRILVRDEAHVDLGGGLGGRDGLDARIGPARDDPRDVAGGLEGVGDLGGKSGQAADELAQRRRSA